MDLTLKCTFLVLICLLVVCVQVSLATPTDSDAGVYKREGHHHHVNQDRLSSAENYLVKYGYLVSDRHVPRSEKRRAISSYQHYTGLRETGKLNRKTMRKMAEPRCGISDDVHPEVKRRKKRQVSDGRVWKRNIITWRPSSYSRKIPRYQQWKTMKQAFHTWEQIIPRKFQYVHEEPDIVIEFVRGIHGDGYYNGFDGRGLTLAHAFRPGLHPISGDTHFDDDEDWSRTRRGNQRNPDLLAVATHEFGHAIGLDHSRNSKSLMSPYFTASKTELTEHDIWAAQVLYGKKEKRIPQRRQNNTASSASSNDVIKQLTTTTATTTTPIAPRFQPRLVPTGPNMKKLPKCQGIDAMFMANDGYVNIIANNTLFQVDRRSVSRAPLNFRKVYPNAPIPVGAAAYIKDRLYLFQGSYVWRYTKHKLDYGFPKKVLTHTTGEQPRAAIVIRGYRSRRMFLFGKTKVWEWSIWTDEVNGQRQYDVTRFWRGVPKSPDAAVTWIDQYIYFVKNNMYFRVSQRSRRLSRGYPRRMPMPLMRGVC